MTALLHVNASPRGEHSDSLAIADHFLEAYRSQHPASAIDTVNLFDDGLPAFGRPAAEAKLATLTGRDVTSEEQVEWDTARGVFDRFAAADRYLFNIPMWNNGIPYPLKWWIDIISQPHWTFSIDEHGYAGLMHGRKAAVIYTSGTFAQTRGPEFGRDFQSTYFEDWLDLIGITDITTTRVQPTILSPTLDGQLADARRWAEHTGAIFN